MKHLFLPLLMTATLACIPPPATASTPAANDNGDGIERTLHPRWRGANTHIKSLPPALIEYLAANKANALRILMELDIHDDAYAKELRTTKRKPKAPTPENPLAPYERHLARLDSLIPLCRQNGIQIILTAGGLFGKSGKHDIFYETGRDQTDTHLIDFWRAISKRYKNEPTIVAYGIRNEPNYRDPIIAKKIWWDSLLPESIKAIRANDKNVWLMVEPPPAGSLPWGFAQIPAIDDPRVIYGLHHYMPHAYTHQGVRGVQKRGPDTRGHYTYPGTAPRFDGSQTPVHWDKDTIEQRVLHEAILFQKRNPGARILVSEFGVIRWAPGGAQWLADSIDLFERHGWDWTFHSLAEWPGWDPTYEADVPLSQRRPKWENGIQETARLQAVKNGWALNAREHSISPPPPPATLADESIERIPHADWRGINARIRYLNESYHAVIDYLADHGANAIRINFEPDTGEKTTSPTPQNPLTPCENNLALLDSFLPVCRQLNVQVILAATPDDAHQADFWRALSKRYKDDPIIVAYEIQNTPDAINAIRANDKNVWLIVPPPPPPPHHRSTTRASSAPTSPMPPTGISPAPLPKKEKNNQQPPKKDYPKPTSSMSSKPAGHSTPRKTTTRKNKPPTKP